MRDCGEVASLVKSNTTNNHLSRLDIIDFLAYEHSYKQADDTWQDDVKFFGVFNKQNGYKYLSSLQQKFTQGDLFLSSYRIDIDHWNEGFVTV